MNPVIATLVRSTLIALGSFFVTKGYIDSDTLQQIVSAIVVLVSAGWGVFDKLGKK